MLECIFFFFQSHEKHQAEDPFENGFGEVTYKALLQKKKMYRRVEKIFPGMMQSVKSLILLCKFSLMQKQFTVKMKTVTKVKESKRNEGAKVHNARVFRVF